jgi:hypothetical protein
MTSWLACKSARACALSDRLKRHVSDGHFFQHDPIEVRFTQLKREGTRLQIARLIPGSYHRKAYV